MANSGFFTKALSNIFNTDRPLRTAMISLALAVPVGVTTHESISQEPDMQRTAVIGEQQFNNLQQDLKTIEGMKQSLLALNAAAEEQKRDIGFQREIGFEITAAAQKYAMARVDFKDALLRSDGISETDAIQLIGKFKSSIGDRTFAEISPSHAAYLHECRADAAPQDMEKCLQRRHKDEGEIAVLTGFITFMMLFGVAPVALWDRKQDLAEINKTAPKRNPAPKKGKQDKIVITIRND